MQRVFLSSTIFFLLSLLTHDCFGAAQKSTRAPIMFLDDAYSSKVLKSYTVDEFLICLKATWIAMHTYDIELDRHITPYEEADSAHTILLNKLRQLLIEAFWDDIVSDTVLQYHHYIENQFSTFVHHELSREALQRNAFCLAMRHARKDHERRHIFRTALQKGYLHHAIVLYHALRKAGRGTACLIQEPDDAHDILMQAWESWKLKYPATTQARAERFWTLMNKVLHLFAQEYYIPLDESPTLMEQHWTFLIIRMLEGSFDDSDLAV